MIKCRLPIPVYWSHLTVQRKRRYEDTKLNKFNNLKIRFSLLPSIHYLAMEEKF